MEQLYKYTKQCNRIRIGSSHRRQSSTRKRLRSLLSIMIIKDTSQCIIYNCNALFQGCRETSIHRAAFLFPVSIPDPLYLPLPPPGHATKSLYLDFL